MSSQKSQLDIYIAGYVASWLCCCCGRMVSSCTYYCCMLAITLFHGESVEHGFCVIDSEELLSYVFSAD